MSAIKITGLEEILRKTTDIGNTAAIEALEAAENAAAKLIKDRLQQAAPEKTGQLRRSIRIVKYKDRAQLHGLVSMTVQQGATQKLVVGPDRKNGYYGYFQDVGWDWKPHKPKGPGRYVGEYQRKKEWIGRNPIQGTGWFTNVADTVEPSALKAGEDAFNDVIKRFL